MDHSKLANLISIRSYLELSINTSNKFSKKEKELKQVMNILDQEIVDGCLSLLAKPEDAILAEALAAKAKLIEAYNKAQDIVEENLETKNTTTVSKPLDKPKPKPFKKALAP